MYCRVDQPHSPVRFSQFPTDSIAWLLNYLFATVLDGRNAHLTDGVQRALGREPGDFAEFASRIADSGAWNLPS